MLKWLVFRETHLPQVCLVSMSRPVARIFFTNVGNVLEHISCFYNANDLFSIIILIGHFYWLRNFVGDTINSLPYVCLRYQVPFHLPHNFLLLLFSNKKRYLLFSFFRIFFGWSFLSIRLLGYIGFFSDTFVRFHNIVYIFAKVGHFWSLHWELAELISTAVTEIRHPFLSFNSEAVRPPHFVHNCITIRNIDVMFSGNTLETRGHYLLMFISI